MDKFANLEKWLLDNGATFPKLYLKVKHLSQYKRRQLVSEYIFICLLILQDYGNEVRGCHSKQDVETDEVIIDIPLKCLITVEMGKETDVSTLLIL